MKKVYLDNCCLNRFFDNQSQKRIRLETEAIKIILEKIETKELIWLGSEALEMEIGNTKSVFRKTALKATTMHTELTVKISENIHNRAIRLTTLGLKFLDTLHIACAEAGGAEILLTTDDKLIKLYQRSILEFDLKVKNPTEWLKEI